MNRTELFTAFNAAVAAKNAAFNAMKDAAKAKSSQYRELHTAWVAARAAMDAAWSRYTESYAV